MRLEDLLVAGARRLAPTSPAARLEMRLLARHVLGVNDTWLIAHGRDELDADVAARLEALIARRVGGEPVAYILGEREFYGRRFRVTPDTLIPRPETEHLVDAALERMAGRPTASVLDIGTGTGCIAITLKLEQPAWSVSAIDISERTLTVARTNGALLNAEVEWLPGDLYGAVADRRFDLIVSNPPYVAEGDAHLTQGDLRFEPAGALASGKDGLDALREIVKSAPTHLEPGGWLMVEHGWDQGNALAGLLAEADFDECFLIRDLAGQARVSGGRRRG
jgi:release factor glutamine methyltransferase